MKFDFESLTVEPLIYMLTHSGIFVCVLGGIFFIVGLLFGYATWGRYKKQTKALMKEADAMKGEIADLKRKIADHAVKSGPVIAMATETIQMPKKETAAAAVPAPVASSSAVPLVAKAPPAAAQAPAPAAASSAEPDMIFPMVEPPLQERHVSPLAAIIATHPHEKDEESKAEADAIAIPSELSVAPLPEIHAEPEITGPEPMIKTEPETRPEADSKLGLIYKARPEKVDDLTKLHGIAQVLQQRLNECGVYTYEQIAAWNEDNIREFSSKLAFKDRIQREHWVEQAAKLAAGGKKAA